MGIPKYTWLKAIILLPVIQLITRYISPESENINLAFHVEKGWENIFPSYFWYEVMLLSNALVCFLISEMVLRKLLKFRNIKNNFL